MKQKLVNFDDELFEKLEEKANENRRPVNTEIVIAVENHLQLSNLEVK